MYKYHMEYFIHDPVKGVFLGRNFCGGKEPTKHIGFATVEDAERHLMENLQKYMEDYSFGNLQIVRGFGDTEIFEIHGNSYLKYLKTEPVA